MMQSCYACLCGLGRGLVHFCIRTHLSILTQFPLCQVEVGQQDSAVELLEPVPEHRRVTIDYRNLNAWVAAFVAKGGLFPGLSLPSLDLAKIGRSLRGKSVEDDKRDRLIGSTNGSPKERQASTPAFVSVVKSTLRSVVS